MSKNGNKRFYVFFENHMHKNYNLEKKDVEICKYYIIRKQELASNF